MAYMNRLSLSDEGRRFHERMFVGLSRYLRRLLSP